MRGDEIRARQAIAVEEDANFSGTGENAAVADLTAAKTAMFVPDVLERHRQPRLPAFDDVRCFRPRTVVGDDDLEILVRLTSQCAQGGIERIHAVIGRDDDGNERRAAHDLAPVRRVAVAAMPRRLQNP